mmetsp:Transcript_15916/g.46440  ORF Transcript_15916/g.46440 Transcript_15916/m.46440 type:complete len:294 (+) Transcript_15916:979-1860(+)
MQAGLQVARGLARGRRRALGGLGPLPLVRSVRLLVVLGLGHGHARRRRVLVLGAGLVRLHGTLPHGHRRLRAAGARVRVRLLGLVWELLLARGQVAHGQRVDDVRVYVGPGGGGDPEVDFRRHLEPLVTGLRGEAGRELARARPVQKHREDAPPVGDARSHRLFPVPVVREAHANLVVGVLRQLLVRQILAVVHHGDHERFAIVLLVRTLVRVEEDAKAIVVRVVAIDGAVGTLVEGEPEGEAAPCAARRGTANVEFEVNLPLARDHGLLAPHPANLVLCRGSERDKVVCEKG